MTPTKQSNYRGQVYVYLLTLIIEGYIKVCLFVVVCTKDSFRKYMYSFYVKYKTAHIKPHLDRMIQMELTLYCTCAKY